ncbi:MAG TPA: hypothetical protein VFG07_03020 [Thermoplasmata archaeon]|nr:hypothetical protein [Thermoplasmata archaeon]
MRGTPSGVKTVVAASIAALAAIVAGTVPFIISSDSGTRPLTVYNLAPTFRDAHNDEIWDPNFLPGFNGTPGVHINWSDPFGGPGVLSYYVGPWTNGSVAAYPHFGVGPQAFNFVEVPRTQVFRSPEWGDYQNVRQGFQACAVNLGNYTVNPTQALHPVYIGMPEDGVDWSVQLALHWNLPVVTAGLPVDARFELVTTTTLPALSANTTPRLVYTEFVLWSAASSIALASRSLPQSEPAASDVAGDVSFTLDSLPSASVDRTYVIPISSYLDQTFNRLGLSPEGALLSYVYLSAAGYNVHLSTSISGLWLESPSSLC